MSPEHQTPPSPLNTSSDLLLYTNKIAEVDPQLSHLLISLAQTALASQLEIESINLNNPEVTKDTLTKLAQAMENISTLTSQTAVETLEQVVHGQKMEKLVRIDSLTGLPNKTRIIEELESVIDLYKRSIYDSDKKPENNFSFMFIDLDDFKQINDIYGHHVGDEALKHFSKILSNNIRPSDLVGRIHGDEFGIITPETGSEGAKKLVSRILDTLEKKPLIFEERVIPLNASIGITSSEDYKNSDINELNPQKILKDADDAMYVSKIEKKEL